MRETVSSESAPAPTLPERQHADEDVVMFLEPDQLVLDKLRPVRRARLSPRQTAALWALRTLVVVLGAMVIYTFFSQLTG
jgi:hypothetical protein